MWSIRTPSARLNESGFPDGTWICQRAASDEVVKQIEPLAIVSHLSEQDSNHNEDYHWLVRGP